MSSNRHPSLEHTPDTPAGGSLRSRPDYRPQPVRHREVDALLGTCFCASWLRAMSTQGSRQGFISFAYD